MERQKTERKPRKAVEKCYIHVTDGIRIMVEDDNIKTIQLENGNVDGEIVWKNDGFYGDWSSLLKSLHNRLITEHLVREASSRNGYCSLLDLKKIFDDTKDFLEKEFKY